MPHSRRCSENTEDTRLSPKYYSKLVLFVIIFHACCIYFFKLSFLSFFLCIDTSVFLTMGLSSPPLCPMCVCLFFLPATPLTLHTHKNAISRAHTHAQRYTCRDPLSVLLPFISSIWSKACGWVCGWVRYR
jgi:hypothetical protein